MHERKLSAEHAGDRGRLRFSRLWVPALLFVASVGLYIAGNVTEFIFLTSADAGGDGICLKSFTLVQLGNALVDDASLVGNAAPGQTWFLYAVYVALILALPVLAHALQLAVLVGRARSRGGDRRTAAWTARASAVWCFSCVEVLVFGIFAIESKFEDFITNVGGIAENADLFEIRSGLGPGFYVLVAYSVVACVLQWSLGARRDDAAAAAAKGEGAYEGGTTTA